MKIALLIGSIVFFGCSSEGAATGDNDFVSGLDESFTHLASARAVKADTVIAYTLGDAVAGSEGAVAFEAYVARKDVCVGAGLTAKDLSRVRGVATKTAFDRALKTRDALDISEQHGYRITDVVDEGVSINGSKRQLADFSLARNDDGQSTKIYQNGAEIGTFGDWRLPSSHTMQDLLNVLPKQPCK